MKAIKDYEAGKDLPVRIITAEEVFPAEVARKALPARCSARGPYAGRPRAGRAEKCTKKPFHLNTD